MAGIRRTLLGSAPLEPARFEALTRLLDRFPQAPLVRDAYQAALVRRGDWEALEAWLTAVPAEQRAPAQQRNLVNVYYRLGRYQDALDASARLDSETLASPESIEVVATSLFRLGRLEEAASLLDRNLDALRGARRGSALGLRGLVHLHRAEYDEARIRLDEALRIDGNDRASLLARARLHHRDGRSEDAAALLERADVLQQRATQRDTDAMRLVERVRMLKEDWSAGRHAEVIRHAEAALPLADDAMKPVLYEYIAESSERLGRTEEARAARAARASLTP